MTLNPQPKLDQNGKQKYTRDGAPMFQTQMQALDEDGASIASQYPACTKSVFLHR